MKNSLIINVLAFGLVFTSCQNNQKEQNQASVNPAPPPVVQNAPVITFEEPTVDFGQIVEGDTIVHIFKFKNTGSMPLAISHAQASCGCTVPEWPKEPIQPGESSQIKMMFRSKNKKGIQNKTITIYANTRPEVNKVSFRVDVQPSKASMEARKAAVETK